jgi:hypothetical protein
MERDLETLKKKRTAFYSQVRLGLCSVHLTYRLAEPIVYGLFYYVTLAVSPVATLDESTTLLLRPLLLSSQLSKESLAKKVSESMDAKTPTPTSETALQKKTLVRNHRAAQNIYTMIRVCRFRFP